MVSKANMGSVIDHFTESLIVYALLCLACQSDVFAQLPFGEDAELVTRPSHSFQSFVLIAFERWFNVNQGRMNDNQIRFSVVLGRLRGGFDPLVLF